MRRIVRFQLLLCCRSDMEGVELWAPKLTYMGLRCSHELRHVRIVDDAAGSQLPRIEVGLL